MVAQPADPNADDAIEMAAASEAIQEGRGERDTVGTREEWAAQTGVGIKYDTKTGDLGAGAERRSVSANDAAAGMVSVGALYYMMGPNVKKEVGKALRALQRKPAANDVLLRSENPNAGMNRVRRFMIAPTNLGGLDAPARCFVWGKAPNHARGTLVEDAPTVNAKFSRLQTMNPLVSERSDEKLAQAAAARTAAKRRGGAAKPGAAAAAATTPTSDVPSMQQVNEAVDAGAAYVADSAKDAANQAANLVTTGVGKAAKMLERGKGMVAAGLPSEAKTIVDNVDQAVRGAATAATAVANSERVREVASHVANAANLAAETATTQARRGVDNAASMVQQFDEQYDTKIAHSAKRAGKQIHEAQKALDGSSHGQRFKQNLHADPSTAAVAALGAVLAYTGVKDRARVRKVQALYAAALAYDAYKDDFPDKIQHPEQRTDTFATVGADPSALSAAAKRTNGVFKGSSFASVAKRARRLLENDRPFAPRLDIDALENASYQGEFRNKCTQLHQLFEKHADAGTVDADHKEQTPYDPKNDPLAELRYQLAHQAHKYQFPIFAVHLFREDGSPRRSAGEIAHAIMDTSYVDARLRFMWGVPRRMWRAVENSPVIGSIFSGTRKAVNKVYATLKSISPFRFEGGGARSRRRRRLRASSLSKRRPQRQQSQRVPGPPRQRPRARRMTRRRIAV
jgi:hypothetical protein